MWYRLGVVAGHGAVLLSKVRYHKQTYDTLRTNLTSKETTHYILQGIQFLVARAQNKMYVKFVYPIQNLNRKEY